MATRIPKMCKHKATGQAFVVLGGKWVYLGLHGTEKAATAYDEAIASWLINGRKQACEPTTREYTIADLVNEYTSIANKRSKSADGKPTSFCRKIKNVGSEFSKQQGNIACRDYTLSRYRQMRDHWLSLELVYDTIKSYLSILKSILAYGFEKDRIPASVYAEIKATELPLFAAVRENDPVTAIPEEDFDKILQASRNELSRDYFKLLWLTGARGGELIQLDTSKIDKTRHVWRWKPPMHKTMKKSTRVILFGPQAQSILSKYQSTPFASAQNTWYLRFVAACKRAKVSRYHIHQIRHSAATRYAREHGVEIARIILGHSVGNPTTSIYAERDYTLAEKAVAISG